ncbi:hypothetical protein [Mycolicibacterium sp. XJ1819]
MGEIIRVDAFAMEAVAECLENAASDILLTDLNWPRKPPESVLTALDVHVESARLWTESVVERLQVWASRAGVIALALERHQARRPR